MAHDRDSIGMHECTIPDEHDDTEDTQKQPNTQDTSSAPQTPDQKHDEIEPCALLRLPAGVRTLIYDYVFATDTYRIRNYATEPGFMGYPLDRRQTFGKPSDHPGLLCTSKRVCADALSYYLETMTLDIIFYRASDLRDFHIEVRNANTPRWDGCDNVSSRTAYKIVDFRHLSRFRRIHIYFTPERRDEPWEAIATTLRQVLGLLDQCRQLKHLEVSLDDNFVVESLKPTDHQAMVQASQDVDCPGTVCSYPEHWVKSRSTETTGSSTHDMASNQAAQAGPCPFLAIQPELRLLIYAYIIPPETMNVSDRAHRRAIIKGRLNHIALMSTNRQIHHEARRVLLHQTGHVLELRGRVEYKHWHTELPRMQRTLAYFTQPQDIKRPRICLAKGYSGFDSMDQREGEPTWAQTAEGLKNVLVALDFCRNVTHLNMHLDDEYDRGTWNYAAYDATSEDDAALVTVLQSIQCKGRVHFERTWFPDRWGEAWPMCARGDVKSMFREGKH